MIGRLFYVLTFRRDSISESSVNVQSGHIWEFNILYEIAEIFVICEKIPKIMKPQGLSPSLKLQIFVHTSENTFTT